MRDPRTRGDMKSINRLILGVVSTLLFTVGLNAAGERIDPMSRHLDRWANDTVQTASPDCIQLCDIVEDANQP